VVAHRLSTVRRCDRIVELENGVLKAYGSFEELQHQSQAFDAMARLEGEALSQA
jgi:ATP-binding cassette subfamily B protein